MKAEAHRWIATVSALVIAGVLLFGCLVCSGCGVVYGVAYLYALRERELDRQDPFRKFR